MATAADKLVGTVLILIGLITFLYYSTWVLVLPFVDPSHPLQAYFLPRPYTVIVPGLLLVGGVSAIAAFFYLIKSRAARAKAAATPNAPAANKVKAT
ncbi:hypothetical protein CAOG_009754 [Capsaspora owczarzaki ATCC 30864]|uniref:Dolichol phosphate-mannose biosynthesis regulatory protein n=1 Tax=Capsaspora owczarzaki (strain ATCC 30864) TaxID=595528 RepID=A0A0D2WQX5_CAPO3|nr:hypothetical protein CAOG_009754 [Capsaspora owczarzaki ATCC 30864]